MLSNATMFCTICVEFAMGAIWVLAALTLTIIHHQRRLLSWAAAAEFFLAVMGIQKCTQC